LIEPRFFSAEYKGLIAAPGTPKAQTTPSRSRIRTAASIARIFAICIPLFVAVRSSGGMTRHLNRLEFISHDAADVPKARRSQ
jgi:hypothetical protein